MLGMAGYGLARRGAAMLGMAGVVPNWGLARHGAVWQSLARHGRSGQGEEIVTRQGEVCRGRVRRGQEGYGPEGYGMAWWGRGIVASHGRAWCGTAELGRVWRGPAGHGVFFLAPCITLQ